MEESPFDSLARGLNKDLSILLDPKEAPLSTPRMQLGNVFGTPDVVFGLGQSSVRSIRQQPFESLSDRFAEEIALFPLSKRVVINRFGAFVPQSIFGSETNIAYKEERNRDGTIQVIVHSKQPHVPATPRPQFGSARGLIKISDDFDEPLEDFADYM
jgi:hypothetical protein